MTFKEHFESCKNENGFIITLIAYMSASVLMIIVIPQYLISYYQFKRYSKKSKEMKLESKETLLEQCVKELIKRKIDFVLCFQGTYGGWIENEPNAVDTFVIYFDSENDVHSFTVANRKITTIEELLKLKPFTTD